MEIANGVKNRTTLSLFINIYYDDHNNYVSITFYQIMTKKLKANNNFETPDYMVRISDKLITNSLCRPVVVVERRLQDHIRLCLSVCELMFPRSRR